MGWQAFEELLTVSLSMAVAVVPEGLPAVITVTLAYWHAAHGPAARADPAAPGSRDTGIGDDNLLR